MKKTGILLIILAVMMSCEQRADRTTTVTETDTVYVPHEQQTDGARPTPDRQPGTADEPPVVTPSTPQTFTIERGSAGRVRLGMSTTDLRTIFPENEIRASTNNNAGIPSPVTEIIRNGQVSLRIESECSGNNCTVNKIRVLDNSYKTANGIGIGSTLGELKQQHNVSRVTLSTGGEMHARVDPLQAAFQLDHRSYQIDVTRPLDLGTLPDAMTIRSILID